MLELGFIRGTSTACEGTMPLRHRPGVHRSECHGTDRACREIRQRMEVKMPDKKKLVLNKAKHKKAMDAAEQAEKSLKDLSKQADKLASEYRSIEKLKS